MLGVEFGFWWVLHYGVGSPQCSVALRAKVEALVASWRVGEGVEGLELEWWLLCGEVEVFEVLSRGGGSSVCGGFWELWWVSG